MKTLDPSIRQAAQRVTAWHVARWRAHVEPPEPTLPPPTPGPDVVPPVIDPAAPDQTPPVQDPPKPKLAS